MSSDLNEELAYQKNRAERAEALLESERKEAKQLEDFLEEQSNKKQAEIRKLKQDAIVKEKGYKAQKAELIQLQAEVTNLKEQLATSQPLNNPVDSLQSKELDAEIGLLKSKIEVLSAQLSKQKENTHTQQQLNKSHQVQWQRKQKLLREQIQMAKNLAQELKKYNNILNEKLTIYTKPQPQKSKEPSLEKKNSKNQLKNSKESIDKERYEERIKNLEGAIHKLEDLLTQNDKILKQYKYKIQSLTEVNQTLQAKISTLSNANNNLSQSFPSPFTLRTSIEEEQDYNWSKINYSCLLLTKSHYISPFLEVYQDKKLLKIYKSTRTGCFERSMGYYRHKFDVLTFEQDQIIEPIVQAILQSDETTQHSIILYGVKKSNKKYIMSKILVRLKNFLISKLENCDEPTSIFIKRSQEEEKNLINKGNNKRQILDIMNQVIALGYKNDKGKDKYGMSPKKRQSKPKVRYFNFIANSFYLEIGTSSFANLSFREKMTPINMLNNILYSKLPDILQSSISQKYLILTINPIVDLYEECKNTLSTTFCRAYQPKQDDQPKDWRNSPIREELNEAAKKKLDTIERENEQNLLRTRRLEDECQYYKLRFDELQFRLKNLLNTHNGQISYLKKSPVLLSYQKLLKFVHGVQSRTTVSNSFTQLENSFLNKSNNIYIEKDNESIDAL